MSSSLRRGFLALVVVGPAFLVGCHADPPVTAPGRQAYSLNTPICNIAANKQGKAILERDLPGLMASRSYPLIDGMSLTQLATMSGGRLSQSKLQLVQADLAQLPSTAEGGP